MYDKEGNGWTTSKEVKDEMSSFHMYTLYSYELTFWVVCTLTRREYLLTICDGFYLFYTSWQYHCNDLAMFWLFQDTPIIH